MALLLGIRTFVIGWEVVSPQVDPERIAHFRIVGRLGQGGMGIVYRAEDERLRRTVALKVLPDAFAGDEDRRRRLLREARSAAALTHANIATVYEVDEDGGRVFIAMELVEGETLRDRIARGRIPVGEVVRIARGIARGLARAHAKGIVHRDLKPDNVVIDLDGEPKILDFGLAKLREDEQSLGKSAIESGETASQITREGHLLGTPQYMSPEQAGGGPADARSDVFALGILMYEMLTARRPFEAERLGELLAQIQRDPPTPLQEITSDVPADLAGDRRAVHGEASGGEVRDRRRGVHRSRRRSDERREEPGGTGDACADQEQVTPLSGDGAGLRRLGGCSGRVLRAFACLAISRLARVAERAGDDRLAPAEDHDPGGRDPVRGGAPGSTRRIR